MFSMRAAAAEGVAPVPVALEDYRKYVDGRPRSAIRAFLTARGDGPDVETVNGLAEREDGLSVALMRSDGWMSIHPRWP